jgi:hypothetical protein
MLSPALGCRDGRYQIFGWHYQANVLMGRHIASGWQQLGQPGLRNGDKHFGKEHAHAT